MPDILHDFPVNVPPAKVYEAVSSPQGLDQWWTMTCTGRAEAGGTYELGFGSGYDWKARVTEAQPGKAFVLELTGADADWTGTTVGFELVQANSGTQVRFRHAGWKEANAHFRTSSYCWAMYLRVLKRYLERGEVVGYADRFGD